MKRSNNRYPAFMSSMPSVCILVFLAVMPMLCGCSDDKKAESLIMESVKKTLFKPESYEAIETKLDSAFAPYDDYVLWEELAEINNINMEYQELEDKMKRARTSMAIWHTGSYSEFAKNRYRDAKEEYDKATEELERLKKNGAERLEKAMDMMRGEKKFIGFRAFHSYRADTNSGNTLIGNMIFFFDKDLDKIVYFTEGDESDYKKIRDSIKEFNEQK